MFISPMLGLLAIATATPTTAGLENPAYPPIEAKFDASYRFTENRGQWDTKAKFMATGHGVNLWVTNTGVVYDWQGSSDGSEPGEHRHYTIDVEFEGATGNGVATGINQRPGLSNFYLGERQAANVRSYAAGEIRDLYPGIDLVAYFDTLEKRPRYDLIVHPGADASQIRMKYKNAKNLQVDKEGAVEYDTPFGHVSERRQMAYQRSDVGPDYHGFPRQFRNDDGTISFDVTEFRKDRTLVIDPVIWSSYLPGAFEIVVGTVYDASDNCYVASMVSGVTFAVSGAYTALGETSSSVIWKFDSSGRLSYITLYGGMIGNILNFDFPSAIACDAAGNVVFSDVTTNSTSLPGAGVSPVSPYNGPALVRLDPFGALVGAQYLYDPNAIQYPAPIALTAAPNGSFYLANVKFITGSRYFAGVSKISDNGTSLLSSSYLPLGLSQVGNVSLAADASSNLFLAFDCQENHVAANLNFGVPGFQTANPTAGDDTIPSTMFAAKFNADLILQGGTYIGGTGAAYLSLKHPFSFSGGGAIALDSQGNVFVTGTTSSGSSKGGIPVANNFPTGNGGYTFGDLSHAQFVTKFSNDLTQLMNVAQTSGATTADASTIAIDKNDCPVIAGTCGAGGVPLTWDYYSGHFTGNYLYRLSNDLTQVLYGTDLDLGYLASVAVRSDNAITFAAYDDTYTTDSQGSGGSYVTTFDTTATPGLSRLATDRGTSPSIAGGVGNSLTVTSYFAEPANTSITLSSDRPDLVQINGGASASQTVTGYVHALSFTVTPTTDVATATPVNLTASDGTNTQSITLSINPFIRTLVTRPTIAVSGSPLTAYVYLCELPKTDQQVSFTTNPGGLLTGTTTFTIRGKNSGNTASGPQTFALTPSNPAATTAASLTASLVGGHSSASAAVTFKSAAISSAVFTNTPDAGSNANFVVTLNSPPTSDQTIAFTSTNPLIAGDATVTIHAGSTSGTVSVPTHATFSTDATVSVGYSATFNGTSASATLKVVPNNFLVFVSGGTAIEGDSVTCFVLFQKPLLESRAFGISSNCYSVPAQSITLPAGSSFYTFPLTTAINGVAAPKTATMTMKLVSGTGTSGPGISTTISLLPMLTSINVASTVKGGTPITGSANFAEAYRGSAAITVTSNNGAAYFDTPGTLSKAYSATGLATVPFSIQTQPVTKPTTVTITLPVPLGYPTKSFTVTINP